MDFDLALQREVRNFLGTQRPTADQLQDLKDSVRQRARFQRPVHTGRVSDPQSEAKAITNSPQYLDVGTSQSSNWIAQSYKRLAEMLSRIKAPRPPAGASAPSLGGLRWLVNVMWGLLVAGVCVFLILVIRNFAWKKASKKMGVGMLDSDEPDRTADEWLDQAAALERAGKFREAVRCLYIAALIRIDEAKVARFIRTETNWEHFDRITLSPKKPPELEFRPATKSFDCIWYGDEPATAANVAHFREFYLRTTELLRSGITR